MAKKHLKFRTTDEVTHKLLVTELENKGFKTVTSYVVDINAGYRIEKFVNVWVQTAKQAKLATDIADGIRSQAVEENNG